MASTSKTLQDRPDVAWVVTCARCGQNWPEDGPVDYRDGDWWCRHEHECDDRIAEARYGHA